MKAEETATKAKAEDAQMSHREILSVLLTQAWPNTPELRTRSLVAIGLMLSSKLPLLLHEDQELLVCALEGFTKLLFMNRVTKENHYVRQILSIFHPDLFILDMLVRCVFTRRLCAQIAIFDVYHAKVQTFLVVAK